MESSMKGVLVGRDAGRAALGLLHSNGSSLDARPHGVRLSVWSSGSVVALIDDVPTCRELIERLVAEATDAIHSASACVDTTMTGKATIYNILLIVLFEETCIIQLLLELARAYIHACMHAQRDNAS